MASGSSEKQGHLGDLTGMSDPELRDLISRQKKLLRNRKFIENLPDKGEKIRMFLKRLEDTLVQHAYVDETTDLFQKMALTAESTNRGRGQLNEVDENDTETIRDIVNMEYKGKVIQDERKEGSEHFINCYSRVMLLAEKKNSNKIPKFHPNRDIKAKSIHDLDLENFAKLNITDAQSHQHIHGNSEVNLSESHSRQDAQTTNKDSEKCSDKRSETVSERGNEKEPQNLKQLNSTLNETGNSSQIQTRSSRLADTNRDKLGCGLKFHYDESLESSAAWTNPKFQSTKLISVEESFKLFESQRKKLQQLQTKQATERLAQHIHVNMTTFDPEGSRKTAYRQREDDVSDSDGQQDSDDGLDYPD